MVIKLAMPIGRSKTTGPTGPTGKTANMCPEHLLRIYKNTVILLGDTEIDKEELFNFALTCDVLHYIDTNQLKILFNDPEFNLRIL